jgi:hypothetical protein
MLVLALSAALLAVWAPFPAQAQPRPAVLTFVAGDGNLWALPAGAAPRLVRRDVARGATVPALAWHPSRPALLVVRQVWRGEGAAREPYDTLLSLDLATGDEQVLYPDVGPQARITQPSYGPDGTWSYAQVACCLDFNLVVFDGGAPRRVPSNTFLPPAQRDPTLAFVGPVAPDGRILMRVTCCLDGTPPQDPSGVYLVPRDFSSYERIAPGRDLVPLGLGPAGAWLAGLRREEQPEGESSPALVVVDLPGGAQRTLVARNALPLAERGAVAPDGTIAVATQISDDYPIVLDDVETVAPATGARRNATRGAYPGISAFGWAPAAVLDAVPAP